MTQQPTEEQTIQPIYTYHAALDKPLMYPINVNWPAMPESESFEDTRQMYLTGLELFGYLPEDINSDAPIILSHYAFAVLPHRPELQQTDWLGKDGQKLKPFEWCIFLVLNGKAQVIFCEYLHDVLGFMQYYHDMISQVLAWQG